MAIDGYCRQQDLIGNLQKRDVVYSTQGNDVRACCLFGRAGRGESSKTGRNQGVVLDEPHSLQILQKRCEGLCPKDKVFNISREAARKWWLTAAKAVGGNIGPVHSCRHTGPSYDIVHQYRTLDQVMKRGKWKAISSVHRYAKPHTYTAAAAQQTDAVRERGAKILQARARVNESKNEMVELTNFMNTYETYTKLSNTY